MKLPKNLLLIAASGVLSCLASAATIVANAADAEAHADLTAGALNNQTILAGNYYAGANNLTAPVFGFLLPTLSLGESFTNSTVTFTLTSIQGGTGFNANLVGLTRVDASATVLGTDFTAANTALQNNFLTTASIVGQVVSVDISSWLNSQYAGGTNAGKFVFLRLDAPGDTGATFFQGYNIASANNGTVGNHPTINYTASAVPEPSAYGLMGAGAMAGVVILRRRRKASGR